MSKIIFAPNISYTQKEVKIMIKLSLVIDKYVLDATASKIIARIKNAYFMQNCKRIAYFLANITNSNKNVLIPTESITAFADAIVVQNNINFIDENDFDFTSFIGDVMDMPAYTTTGILKGQITEVEFYTNGNVSKLYTQNTAVQPSSILSVGNVILLKNSGRNVKPKVQNIKIPRPETSAPVTLLTDNETLISDSNTMHRKSANTIIVPDAPLAIKLSSKTPYFSQNAIDTILGDKSDAYPLGDTHTPTRVICDYSFLLERTLAKDILSYTGNVIAKKGDLITDDVVASARREGKLVELALNSTR